MLMNIEQSRTPLNGRTRSTTPVRRSTMSATTKTTAVNRFQSAYGTVKTVNNFINATTVRGSIKTSILTSKIHIDKGFTGPKFIEDDLADNIPISDEIPEYFPEDFDFSVPYPLEHNFESASNQPTMNYDVQEIMAQHPMEEIDPDEHFQMLKSKIIDVGKELNELNHKPVENMTEDDIIEAVIESNKKKENIHQQEEKEEANLKLFFGHENWNLMMNMLIGKKYVTLKWARIGSYSSFKPVVFK
jgi:hypothetical protein